MSAIPRTLPESSFRFLDRRLESQENEVIFETRLSLEDDLYLKEHCLYENYIFPAVLGMEAMAQAAAVLTNEFHPKSILFENLNFLAPILVSPSSGNLIRVRATLDTQSSSRIKCSILSESTSFKQSHFVADIVLNANQEFSNTRPLESKEIHADIIEINKYLFQGPKFKKFKKIFNYTDTEFSYSMDVDTPQTTSQKAFLQPSHLILGDLFARDSQLQSLDTVFIQDDSLPTACNKWWIKLDEKSGPHQVQTKGEKSGTQIKGSIIRFDPQGNVTEHIQDLSCKILKHHANRPTHKELIGISAKPDRKTDYSDIYFLKAEPDHTFARWPVLFNDCVSFDYAASFTSVANWIGRIRELVVQIDFPNIEHEFRSRNCGWVTNTVTFKMTRVPRCGDIIDCKLWPHPVVGREDSTVESTYIWHHTDKWGNRKNFCEAKMRTTWVKIIGHGLVEVAPFPESVYKPLSSYFRSDRTQYQIDDKEVIPLLGSSVLKQPLTSFPTLTEKTVETSLINSNLVSNVYFSEYYKWQAILRDSFLNSCLPNLKNGAKEGGPVCAFSDIIFLREVMPFEQLHVKMGLRDIHENGVRLVFEYFKIENDKLVKAAFCSHYMLWCDSTDGLKPLSLPREVVSKINSLY